MYLMDLKKVCNLYEIIIDRPRPNILHDSMLSKTVLKLDRTSSECRYFSGIVCATRSGSIETESAIKAKQATHFRVYSERTAILYWSRSRTLLVIEIPNPNARVKQHRRRKIPAKAATTEESFIGVMSPIFIGKLRVLKTRLPGP
jgi:hypothetical protein